MRPSGRATRLVTTATRPSARATRLVTTAMPPSAPANGLVARACRLVAELRRSRPTLSHLSQVGIGCSRGLPGQKGNAAVTLKTIPSATHAAHLATPEVREAIRAVLKRRTVPEADLEDLTHDVIERALVTPAPPAGLEACKALVSKMASDVAVDSWRRARRRSKVNAGLYENPDNRPGLAVGASDAVHAREQIAFFRGQVDKGVITARQATILARHAEEVPGAEIADELRVAHQTVHNELSAGRRVLRASWAAYAAVGVLAGVSLILWLLHDRDNMAKKTPREEIRPDPSAGPQGPTPLQIARDQRRDALHACDIGNYADCLEGLDRAAKVDPAGDASPAVQEARRNAAQRLDEQQPTRTDGKF